MPWNVMRTNEHDEQEYWNNEYGWVSLIEADQFTDEEKEATHQLPLGGRWVKALSIPEALDELLASADDEGCSGDLIVVSKSALEYLADLIVGTKVL